MLKKTVLRRKSDFASIYKEGKSVGERYVVLIVKKNDLPYNRSAFLASKKIGNSVERNRAKRLMKESHRQIKERLAGGYDMIFVARKTIRDQKMEDVSKSMEAAVKKLGLFTRIKQKDEQVIH